MTESLTGQPSPAGAWSLPGAGSRQAPGLPGLALPGRLPGRLPRELLAPGTLLLAGVEPGRPVNLVEHLRRWGAAPSPAIDELIARVAANEVVGAGGAAFPTDRKLASLVGSRVSHVIVNGAEGETASGKDGVLLGHVPHLVLDGAVTAARALGAPRIILRISADRPDLATSLAIALAARQDGLPIELSIGPATFVAGEATAVIRAITGGPALPADLGRPPSIRSGVARRRSHVLLSNAETFARMALASRGVSGGSALASASGAVRDPGVVELPDSATLADLAAAAGGLVGAPGGPDHRRLARALGPVGRAHRGDRADPGRAGRAGRALGSRGVRLDPRGPAGVGRPGRRRPRAGRGHGRTVRSLLAGTAGRRRRHRRRRRAGRAAGPRSRASWRRWTAGGSAPIRRPPSRRCAAPWT